MSEPQAQNPVPSTPQTPSASPAPSAPAPAPSAAAPAPAAPAASPAPAAPATDGPKPPEGLDARFWDAEKGVVKFDEFTAYAKEVEAYKAAEAVRLAAVPAAADGYKLELPTDLTLPEGVTISLTDGDPRVSAAREFALANKMDQAGFNGLIRLGAQLELQQHMAMHEAVQAEMAKLGTNASARIDAVATALTATMGADRARALATSISSVAAMEGLEMLLRSVSGTGMSGFNQIGRASPEAGIPEDQYARMSPAERLVAARKMNKPTA